MRTLREAVLYGVAAFAIGFVFGALRELVLVPALGAGTGALVEFPLVTAAVVAFAVFRARRVPAGRAAALARGVGGVAVLLAIEVAFLRLALGLPLAPFMASLDPRTGSLFPVGLLAMAIAPPLVARPGR